MTEEEIQKNSEHWYNLYKQAQSQLTEKVKQIEELEKDIEYNSECCLKCGKDWESQKLQKKIVEKDKQIDMLSKRLEKLISDIKDCNNPNVRYNLSDLMRDWELKE